VFFSSEADPSDGFWLELVGTLGLAVSGAALATLRPEQLRMLGKRSERAQAETTEDDAARPAVKRRSAHEGRTRRRTRSR
ncbi:MAG TPA: hypothetical protein VK920_02220, partial [Solirubrobacterales bacterium]|nr:hypothetical protein [Solirubrobacterales bacterium]